jgi:hypothetical protein
MSDEFDHIKSFGETVREIEIAWGMTRNGEQFAQEIKNRGLILVYVSPEEAKGSHRTKESEQTRHLLNEGFAVVDRHGDVIPIDQHTTRARWDEIQNRLSRIDRREVVSVEEACAVMADASRKEIREKKRDQRDAARSQRVAPSDSRPRINHAEPLAAPYEVHTEVAMSDANIIVDRVAIRQMLEDGFQSQLLFQKNYIDTHPRSSRQESIAAGQDFFRRWTERIDATAALMPPEQKSAFMEVVEEEFDFLEQVAERDPNAFSQRLGVNMGKANSQPVYRGQGLGELAVRTAVRATIWELIWSLFRR